MLGPIKKYPNGNIFWKGCDHQNPKKVLHPSVCLFSLIICTVKVCSSNRHYLFSFVFFLTNSQLGLQAVLLFFFFLSGERVLVWNVVTRENCSLRHLPTSRAGCGSPGFWKKNVGTDRSEAETWTDVSNDDLSGVCLHRMSWGRTRVAFSMSLKNVQRPLCHLKNVCDRTWWHDPFLFVWHFFFFILML